MSYEQMSHYRTIILDSILISIHVKIDKNNE